MRRVLTFLTAAVLLLVSLGIGVFTADLPFWRRALQQLTKASVYRSLPLRLHLAMKPAWSLTNIDGRLPMLRVDRSRSAAQVQESM